MRKVLSFLIGAAGVLLPTLVHAQTNDPEVHTRLTLFVIIYALGFCVTILLLFIIARKGNDHEQK